MTDSRCRVVPLRDADRSPVVERRHQWQARLARATAKTQQGYARRMGRRCVTVIRDRFVAQRPGIVWTVREQRELRQHVIATVLDTVAMRTMFQAYKVLPAFYPDAIDAAIMRLGEFA